MGQVQIRQCVCWKARRHPVAEWPYIRAFQMTIPEIIIAVLHCLSNGRQVGLLCVFSLYQCAAVRSLCDTYRKVDESTINIA